MLQRSFGIAPLRQTVSCLPYACLHPPLLELGTEGASQGKSRTSLQRSSGDLLLGLVNQACQFSAKHGLQARVASCQPEYEQIWA
jgi:hypothetical protein